MHSGAVMPGRRVGSGVCKYNPKSPKQDSKRFNSITMTIHFAHLGILFIYRISKQYFLGILFLFLVYDLSIGFQTVISWYIISFLGLLFIYKISKQYFLDQRRHLSTSFPVPSSLWAGDVLGKLLGDKPGRAGPRNKTI